MPETIVNAWDDLMTLYTERNEQWFKLVSALTELAGTADTEGRDIRPVEIVDMLREFFPEDK